MEELIRHVNEIGLLASSGDLDAVIKSANAAPERRIAAVLWYVAGSQLPIAISVAEILALLQDSEWDRPAIDPMETPIGRAVIAHLKDTPDQLRKVMEDEAVERGERLAAQLILRSLESDYDFNKAIDLVLKSITGHNAVWWIEWITEGRSRGTGLP